MSQRIDSEGQLIETYLRPLAQGAEGAFALQDDCALLRPQAGQELVLTTDAIAAGVHFFGDDAPEDIGWKALAVNVSDLAAKAARPVAYLMSLSFPEAPLHHWMERFASGLRAAQDAFGLVLIGGDTDRRPGPLAITVTAIGSVPNGGMVRRGTAAPGDRLYVSGTLGDAAVGLLLRTEPDLARRWGLEDSSRDRLLQRYLRPEPRLELRDALRACASAAMDISDGLAKDLGRLCAASGTGALVETAHVPISAAAAAALACDQSLIECVLAGGDDFEILAAVPEARSADYESLARQASVDVCHIGRIRSAPSVMLADRNGQPVMLSRSGWDHF